MSDILFILPGNETLGNGIASHLAWPKGSFQLRRFPDGESYVRILEPIAGASVYLVCSLVQPDEKLVPLLWLAAAARDLGAKKVVLVAPYLAYLRQDACFQAGEALSSRYFAQLLSGYFDALVTVDPHLHRYHSLAEIYRIPAVAISAASEIAKWVAANIAKPIFVGPDRESEQWVSQVARMAGAPYLVAEKLRKGDRRVEVQLPDWKAGQGFTPVLVDDIISTARTMIETVLLLRGLGSQPPCCVGVHGIFSGTAYADLSASGAGEIVTCNSAEHPTNRIDLSAGLARALERLP